jgi:hypothetical protein
MRTFVRFAMSFSTVIMLPFAMLVLGFKYGMEYLDEWVRGLR